jgi:cobalt/nickel transport system ATP-binding protein
VRYRYLNGNEALRGVTFNISAGEKVAIVGGNGAGKSTLLLHTNGLLTPTKGIVEIDGRLRTSDPKSLGEVRRKVGVVFQNSDDQLFMSTVEDDVAFGPLNMGLESHEVESRVMEALESVGAAPLLHRQTHTLSVGQKRSVAIASVLSMRPDIMVLDEPSASLDPLSTYRLTELLTSLRHTCLIATHDFAFATRVCDRAIVMRQGEVIADSTCDDIFSDKALLREALLAP